MKELIWLKNNKQYIKIDRIEKDLGLPQGTLKKYVDEKRALPEKWQKQVSDFVKKIKK